MPKITPKEAEVAIEELLKLGLLSEKMENSKQANTIVETPKSEELCQPLLRSFIESLCKRLQKVLILFQENREIFRL